MGSGKGANNSVSWATELEEEYVRRGKHPEGDNWKTFNEIQGEVGCGICKARKMVTEAVSRGELELFHGSARAKNGLLCRQIWYRPVT